MYHVFSAKGVKGVRFLGTGVTDGCKPPCGFWEPNLGPLQKLLTRAVIPTPRFFFSFLKIKLENLLGKMLERKKKNYPVMKAHKEQFKFLSGDFPQFRNGRLISAWWTLV